MRTSWSPLAWSKSVTKDQETKISSPRKPKAIPEDCIILGGYEGDVLVCETSRTDNTDADALSPYSARIHNESWLTIAALTSRTDDTDDGSPQPVTRLQRYSTKEDDGSPRKARRTSRRLQQCTTKDLVDIVDQRTQQVEELLKVGSALVTEKHRLNDASHKVADSPANKDTVHSYDWENLHEEANACLEDLRNRLVTMAEEGSPCADETACIGCGDDEKNVVDEVQKLRQVVDVLTKELSEVKQGEAVLRGEITMLRERLSRVDRQAAKASIDVQELRKTSERSEIQRGAASPRQEAAKSRVPKLPLRAPYARPSFSSGADAPPSKPKIPPLNLSRSTSKQSSGSHARNPRIQTRGALQNTQNSRSFMGENFFKK